MSILEGSWVAISGVISRVARLQLARTAFRVLQTLLLTTHDFSRRVLTLNPKTLNPKP